MSFIPKNRRWYILRGHYICLVITFILGVIRKYILIQDPKNDYHDIYIMLYCNVINHKHN